MSQISLDLCIGEFRKAMKNAGFSTVVVGLSGGVDSAVACGIAKAALGKEAVFPFHFLKTGWTGNALVKPAPMSNVEFAIRRQNLESSAMVADHFELSLQVVSIAEALQALPTTTQLADSIIRTKTAAYLMSGLLHSYSFAKNALICGTLNRTELLVGHYTRNTFERYDLSPIEFLYKNEIRRLAYELGLPEFVAERVSSCGCQANETVQEELPGGLTYAVAEPVLFYTYDYNIIDKERRMAEAGITEQQVQQVLAVCNSKSYKYRRIYTMGSGIAERSKLCK